MFSKVKKTAFPPSHAVVFVWDGACGFCQYWITFWKSKSGANLQFKPYQELASQFPDIPLKEFKKASRLIEPDGTVFSGPDSAYRSFMYFEDPSPGWHKWYIEYKWFSALSDYSYNFVAKHRSLMFGLTKLFFGSNPNSIKPYWFLWLLFLFTLVYLLVNHL